MQQKHFLKPASTIVELLGGVTNTADVLDLNRGTVSRWMTATIDHGTGGQIPQKHWPAILRVAKRRRLKITLQDLSGLKSR
jgi:hypothetical protein